MNRTLFFKELIFGIVLPGIGLGLGSLIFVYCALPKIFHCIFDKKKMVL